MQNEKENLIEINDIEKISDNSFKTQIFLIKNEITEIILNNVKDKLEYQKIFDKISSIISLIQEIYKQKIQQIINQYESNIRRDEQTIRILYKNILTYKLIKDCLESRIRASQIKEIEYELIKQKTGAYIRNGEIIYNSQKDNEIIILRAENSNLKSAIDNYEKVINEKDLLYDKLKLKYNNSQKKLNNKKERQKKLKIPNININLSDSINLTNINNFHHCSLNNSNSDKKYYKTKNFSKIKNIPINCLSYRNIFQRASLYYTPKNKNNNSHSNERKKNSFFENQCDIYSLKKRNIKKGNVFSNHFNLLQLYKTNSSKNMNNFPGHTKISTFSNNIRITKNFNKNNYSQKSNITIKNNNLTKNNKNNKISIESDNNMQMSYLSSIPYIREKDYSTRVSINKNKKDYGYKMIYSKIKKEKKNPKDYNKILYNKKNYNKKYNNINTNKIFLSLNNKKNNETKIKK